MNNRYGLFLCLSFLLLTGLLVFTGCNGVPTPDSIIEGGSTNLPSITLSNLNEEDDPVLLGIGSTFTIEWELSNPPENSKVELLLDEDGDLKTTDDQIRITPEGGVDASEGKFDFTPTEDMKDNQGLKTAVDYTVIAKLSANDFLYDAESSQRKIRIGEGGVNITSPSDNVTKARGLPITINWELTNNICANLPESQKIVKLYLDTGEDFSGNSIEITPADGVEACDGSFELHTGEITGIELDTAYHIIARLFIDNVEHSRDISTATITVVSSLTVTSPTSDIRDDLDRIPVSWQIQGRDATGLFVEILAKRPGVENDPDRIISPQYPATEETGTADASKLPSGTYEIWVRLFEYSDVGEKRQLDTAKAEGRIIVAGGYSGMYDLSDMAAVETKNYSPVDGVIFEGFNINDQVGFEVAGVGDVDGDSYSDILVFSRYGHEYTAGNAGSAYLIYGSDNLPSVVPLNSVPPRGTDGNAAVSGTLLLFPMDNLAAFESNAVKGDYYAMGLPDISGDGHADFIIGCPEAGPLTIVYKNVSGKDKVQFIGHYGLERELSDMSVEPAHVEPRISLSGNKTYPPDLLFGSDYFVGDTIYFEVYSDYEVSLANIYHFGVRRGAYYTLTSQQLQRFKNNVYDLAKIGSPVEEGEPAEEGPIAINGWSILVRIPGQYPNKGRMGTWANWNELTPFAAASPERFADALSILPDIDNDGNPELMVTISEAEAWDLAEHPDGTVSRPNAGTVMMIDAEDEFTSISPVGRISWHWPVYLTGNHRGSDGQDYQVDIIGSQAGSNLLGAAGLGRFELDSENKLQYVNGDFNNDGIADIVVGAPGENSGAGAIYVLYIRPVFARRMAQIDLADFNRDIPITDPDENLQVPILGVKLSGTIAGERLGQIVKPAGDFNGDGLADVMYATPTANGSGRVEAGRVIIMFGQSDLIGDFTVDEIDSHKGTQLPGLIFEGQAPYDHFGMRIVSVGDVNGDGLDDILVAAPDADAPGKNDCGKIYLIYGKKNIIKTDPATGFKYVDYDGDGEPDEFWNVQAIGTLVANEDGSSNADGTKLPGAVFVGEGANNHLQAISPAGDVNGDGVGDFLIGAPQADADYGDHFTQDNNVGKAYLIYGRKSVVP